MGKHKEWRKTAKKMRRKRIRSAAAVKRDEEEKQRMDSISKTPYYKKWLAEQEALDLFREQEEKRSSILAHQKWEYLETLAQERWARQQKLLLEETEKRKEQEELIKKEWEMEQEKEKLEKEEKEKEEKRNRLRYERLMEEMESFIEGTGEKPDSLYTYTETNPGREPCLFFTKVGACRFKDSCSRNHVRPGISNTILLPGFYSHFSLEIGGHGEYDTDINLEFDNTERYRDFEEFFDDITPELEKYGRIYQIRVCSNTEPHLRGNVYVAYHSERAAAAAYKDLSRRYYAGKRISVEFVKIPSWKDAACGLQFRGTCPKGSKCNFLHIFKNPRGKYSSHDMPAQDKKKASATPSGRDWRWTPSPDEELDGECSSSQRQDEWDCDGRDNHHKSSRRSVRDRSSERRSRDRKSERHGSHGSERHRTERRRSRSRNRRGRSKSNDRHSRKSDSERSSRRRDNSRSERSHHRKESVHTKSK